MTLIFPSTMNATGRGVKESSLKAGRPNRSPRIRAIFEKEVCPLLIAFSGEQS